MRPLGFVRTKPKAEEVARLEEQTGRVLDNLREQVLANGLSFADNFQGVPVTFDGFSVPNPWVPLVMQNGCGVYSSADVPAARWASGVWECRGLVAHPVGFSLGYSAQSIIARLPGAVATGPRECITVADNQPALISADQATGGIFWVSGVPSPTAGAGWVSLNNVRFMAQQTTPPEWAKAAQLRHLLPPGTRPPVGYLVLNVAAKDGSSVDAISLDLVVERIGAATQLRLRSASGFVAGKRYTLTLFLLTG